MRGILRAIYGVGSHWIVALNLILILLIGLVTTEFRKAGERRVDIIAEQREVIDLQQQLVDEARDVVAEVGKVTRQILACYYPERVEYYYPQGRITIGDTDILYNLMTGAIFESTSVDSGTITRQAKRRGDR